MVLRASRHLVLRLRDFWGDRSASVTVDFVVSIPILIAVLVITSEYGRVLQMRTTLDNAVTDATRYLTRVQLDESGAFSSGSIAISESLIRDRINSDFIRISEPIIAQVPGAATGVVSVTVEAVVGVDTRALSLLNLVTPGEATLADGTRIRDIEGVVITSSETFTYLGR